MADTDTHIFMLNYIKLNRLMERYTKSVAFFFLNLIINMSTKQHKKGKFILGIFITLGKTHT